MLQTSAVHYQGVPPPENLLLQQVSCSKHSFSKTLTPQLGYPSAGPWAPSGQAWGPRGTPGKIQSKQKRAFHCKAKQSIAKRSKATQCKEQRSKSKQIKEKQNEIIMYQMLLTNVFVIYFIQILKLLQNKVAKSS